LRKKHDLPRFENAHGSVVRRRKGGGLTVSWQARYDLVKRGYRPNSRKIKRTGAKPTSADREYVIAECQKQQAHMLLWAAINAPRKEHPSKWSAEDDRIALLSCSVKERHRLMEGRHTEGAIRTRKNHLMHPERFGQNPSPSRGKPWSQEELRTLREHYPYMGCTPELCAMLPGRSERQIISMASRLRLRCDMSARRSWPTEGLADIMNQIKNMASERGIKIHELDAAAGTGTYFQRWGARKMVAKIEMIIPAVRVLLSWVAPVTGDKRRRAGQNFLSVQRDARRQHALMVDKLVPPNLPNREDVCQELKLALLDGTLTPPQLKRRISHFVSQVRKKNEEMSGYAISLDAPMRGGGNWHERL